MAGAANIHSPSGSPSRPDLGRSSEEGTVESEGRAANGTSLVAVSSAPELKKFGGNSRPAAFFLAQLIATAQQAPQTRQRRRAEGLEVVTHYATATEPAPGKRLRSFI
jgi:hypothetical protein